VTCQAFSLARSLNLQNCRIAEEIMQTQHAVPEQPNNLPEPSDLEYQIREKLAEVEEELQATTEAQDAYEDFMSCLKKINAVAEVIVWAESTGAWLATHAGATLEELNLWREREEDEICLNS
jgi:hypothetical protein